MKRISLFLLIVLCGFGLAACGSSKKAASSTTSTTGGANSFATAYAAYSACMKTNGVTLPANSGPGGGNFRRGEGAPTDGGNNQAPPAGADPTRTRPPTTLPAGVTQAQYDKAEAACASKLPQRGAGGVAGGANSTAFAAYISCLKDNGVTITGTGAQALGSVDRTSATFTAAQTKCAALEPQRNTSSSTTPTTV